MPADETSESDTTFRYREGHRRYVLRAGRVVELDEKPDMETR